MTALDTIKENLHALEKEHGVISEKLLYEISELSDTVFEKIKHSLYSEDTAELFRRSRVATLSSALSTEGTPREYLFALKAREDDAYSISLAAFSLFLSERFRKEEPALLPWHEAHGGARIVYVPASLADEVYFALAKRRREATVLYADSTRATVEMLAAGRADYAMLPYMSAEGELLSGVSRLLSLHDFSFAALVSLSRESGKLVYALLSRTPSPFICTESMNLSFRLTADSFAHLGAMFSAFPVMGYTQSDFFPEREEYGRVCGRVTLTGDGDACALWTYLSLYAVGFSFLGRYPNIDL